MAANVATLHRRSFDLADVIVALRAGDLSGVLERTRNATSAEHSMIRARALLRTRANAEASEVVRGLDTHALATVHRVEVALLRASIAARIGDFDAAASALVDARVQAYSTPHPSVEMDVLVHSAAIAFMANDAELVRANIAEALAIHVDPDLLTIDEPPLWDVDHVTARALEIRAFVAGSEEDFDGQFDLLSRAFEAIRSSSTHDVWLETKLASTLAMHASERGCIRTLGELELWAGGITWSADLALERYHLERSFGLGAALRGDRRVALRWLRSALRHAPTESWQVYVMLDRMQTARSESVPNALLADEIEAVRDAADRIDWAAGTGEAYITLLHLAQAFASIDVRAAQRYLDVYDDLHRRATRDLAGRYDPRRAAYYAFATGAVHAARGNRHEALEAFDRAYATFVAASCAWRAAFVAIERFALDPSRTSRTLADEATSGFGDSWFIGRYRELVRAAG